jgi:signal peptidase I
MTKPQPADARLYRTPADIEDARARHELRAEALRQRLGGVTKVIGGALLLALTLRSLVFEPFTITSPSMQPGLLVGDYLFVAKWPYGYSRYSLPLALPLFDGRLPADRMAKRGDVVVFKSPADNRTDFIKRVIGLPGDSCRAHARAAGAQRHRGAARSRDRRRRRSTASAKRWRGAAMS